MGAFKQLNLFSTFASLLNFINVRCVISKCSKPLSTVVLLLGVYAMHFFLYQGLMTSSGGPASSGIINNGIPHNSSGKHHDPSSVECRSLFKYDAAKQLSHPEPGAIVIELHVNAPQFCLIAGNHIPASSSFQLSDESYKLFVLNGVFLI